MQRLLPPIMAQFQQRVNGLHLSVVSFTDYDINAAQPVQPVNFTNNINTFAQVMSQLRAVGHESTADCYELALHEARTRLAWSPQSVRCLLVVGDSFPHQKGERLKVRSGGKRTEMVVEIDWVQQVQLLQQQVLPPSKTTAYPIFNT